MASLEDLFKEAGEDNFATNIVKLADSKDFPTWDQCDTPEEKGLNTWLNMIVKESGDHVKPILSAAVAAGRYAHPIALKGAGKDNATNLRFDKDHDFNPPASRMDYDGYSEMEKLDAVEAWYKDPSQKNLDAVLIAPDKTRQMNTWDPGMKPGPDRMWQWFTEVGQLCAMGITNHQDGTDAEGPEGWPRSQCAIRSVIAAYKSIQQPEGDRAKELNALGKAIFKGFE